VLNTGHHAKFQDLIARIWAYSYQAWKTSLQKLLFVWIESIPVFSMSSKQYSALQKNQTKNLSLFDSFKENWNSSHSIIFNYHHPMVWHSSGSSPPASHCCSLGSIPGQFLSEHFGFPPSYHSTNALHYPPSGLVQWTHLRLQYQWTPPHRNPTANYHSDPTAIDSLKDLWGCNMIGQWCRSLLHSNITILVQFSFYSPFLTKLWHMTCH
jgi:hypothetical protein